MAYTYPTIQRRPTGGLRPGMRPDPLTMARANQVHSHLQANPTAQLPFNVPQHAMQDAASLAPYLPGARQAQSRMRAVAPMPAGQPLAPPMQTGPPMYGGMAPPQLMRRPMIGSGAGGTGGTVAPLSQIGRRQQLQQLPWWMQWNQPKQPPVFIPRATT